MLSTIAISCIVIFAGNRAAKKDVEKILSANDQIVLYMCGNILPQLDEPSITEVRSVIKQVFMKQIMKGKGLKRASKILGCEPIPTPGSIFACIEKISTSKEYDEDWAVIDIGGATTDCYSVVKEPMRNEYDGVPVFRSGVGEQRITRSVEGDIGLRLNAVNLCSMTEGDKGLSAYAVFVTDHIDHIPQDKDQHRFENLLASSALTLAVKRHAGLLKPIYSVDGQCYRQEGKDLSSITHILISGGTARREEIDAVFSSSNDILQLVPSSPKIVFDTEYLLPLLSVVKEVPEAVLAEYFWKHIMLQGKGA